ncbi:MAG: hypothetical protein AUH85_06925 [Chloroflexi bacterium 13_1_40CM_4_68_4]|nr:MAG: hypothetical protein AUH85_06925 [Chloroflexi bacterium 13_1_40CM_4_68_4]
MIVGRVAVAGHSMLPALRDGEFLIYTSLLAPRRGDVVVARDPRDGRRWLVKRVREVRADALDLSGDLEGHDAGWIPRNAILGRVVFRYWPPVRARFL